ncbi:unnamed protein product [Arabidopsis halleri]
MVLSFAYLRDGFTKSHDESKLRSCIMAIHNQTGD